MNQYPDDIFIKWHVDSYGSKYSIRRDKETYVVVGNKIMLNEIPDKQDGMKILNMQETDKIEYEHDYKVDYINGCVFLDPSKEGLVITIETYYGRGLIMYPASRIYMLDINNNTITLEEKILKLEQQLATLL